MNRNRLPEKRKNRYHSGDGKEKAAKYYEDNTDVLKRNARNKYKNLPEREKKEVKRAYGRDIYRNMNEGKENKLKKYKKLSRGKILIFSVQYKNGWKDFKI